MDIQFIMMMGIINIFRKEKFMKNIKKLKDIPDMERVLAKKQEWTLN